MNKTDKPQPTFQVGLLQTDPRTSPAIRDKLGEKLRTMYGNLEEPLSDRLLALVKQLDEPRRRRKP